MASSNRHWPSMFKSKPCNSHHHQWQHDINSSIIQQRPPCNPEERSPEPKPRWNPRPEQIRILEAIFNSGMVNPPRDEIRKIRAKLQEYGQVGDANVFYWFQNRKSRSKHKQRHLQAKAQQQHHNNNNNSSHQPIITSSSSSSDKSSPNSLTFSIGTSNVMDLLNSPTSSVNQQNYNEFLSNEQPFFFTVQPPPVVPTHDHSAGFCFQDSSTFTPHSSSSGLLLNEWMGGISTQAPNNSKKDENDKINLQSQLMSYTVTSTVSPLATTTIPTISHIQGVTVDPNDAGPTRSTVFINDVAFEVGIGPFNVREVFGEDAVLIHSSGEPLITNEWGITIQPLQHGAFYYLLRTSSIASTHHI
ncbi:compound inflorescence isoform X1 [Solanum lycopersicum]|uniref:Protein WUSCHEL n=3 Tax=Solanum lycopersicum TaxID=4081 RepID=B6E0Y5_SOLLC|nr:compound inflorescence [Solanum lycopersicum]XP_010315847.1 compound inflorescence isoform X1 [Solanum lycopersicum]ACI23247.1 COMPOUND INFLORESCENCE [Solanum lycopersicum]ACI23248.1 COMPOUND INFLORESCENCE [Solanum lycopersicum]